MWYVIHETGVGKFYTTEIFPYCLIFSYVIRMFMVYKRMRTATMLRCWKNRMRMGICWCAMCMDMISLVKREMARPVLPLRWPWQHPHPDRYDRNRDRYLSVRCVWITAWQNRQHDQSFLAKRGIVMMVIFKAESCFSGIRNIAINGWKQGARSKEQSSKVAK